MKRLTLQLKSDKRKGSEPALGNCHNCMGCTPVSEEEFLTSLLLALSHVSLKAHHPRTGSKMSDVSLARPATAGRYLIPCFLLLYLYCCFIQLLFHAKCTQSPCSGGRVWITFQLLCQKWGCLSCIPHAPYFSTKHVFISIEANKYSFVICLSLVNSFFSWPFFCKNGRCGFKHLWNLERSTLNVTSQPKEVTLLCAPVTVDTQSRPQEKAVRGTLWAPV